MKPSIRIASRVASRVILLSFMTFLGLTFWGTSLHAQVPFTSDPPVIDGVLVVGEWDGAYRFSMTNSGSEIDVAEIELYEGPIPATRPSAVTNVATDGTATQSSSHPLGDASKAIDGDTNGQFSGGSVTHTADAAVA